MHDGLGLWFEFGNVIFLYDYTLKMTFVPLDLGGDMDEVEAYRWSQINVI